MRTCTSNKPALVRCAGFAWRCLVAVVLLLSTASMCVAQEFGLPKRTVEPQKQQRPPSKPNTPKPKPEVSYDVRIRTDDDCLLTIDGVLQKDTLKVGEVFQKKLVAGPHKIHAESIATGFSYNHQVKVDATINKPVDLEVKEKFDEHDRKVSAALSRRKQQ